RSAAIEALKARDEQEYTAILLEGLRYPWPAVAENAADAIARLQRIDLVDQLVEMLDQPDPRDPVTEDSGKHKITVVRDLVRINHHRNCLLCHAPGNTDDVSQEVVTGAMPVPGESFDSRSSRYGGSPDILVRADVTYLRQDFSEMPSVANAAPWPALQRFDFLVRLPPLSAAPAAAYRA